jgi:hypothetical protein
MWFVFGIVLGFGAGIIATVSAIRWAISDQCHDA